MSSPTYYWIIDPDLSNEAKDSDSVDIEWMAIRFTSAQFGALLEWVKARQRAMEPWEAESAKFKKNLPLFEEVLLIQNDDYLDSHPIDFVNLFGEETPYNVPCFLSSVPPERINQDYANVRIASISINEKYFFFTIAFSPWGPEDTGWFDPDQMKEAYRKLILLENPPTREDVLREEEILFDP